MSIKNSSICVAFLAALLFTIPGDVAGKRVAPREVPPVVGDGIKYSADGDGKVGYIVAEDINSGKELWRSRVFRIHTHIWKGEEDNQWIFICDINLVRGALLIRDECSRCYRLDLDTKRVKREVCRELAQSPCPNWTCPHF